MSPAIRVSWMAAVRDYQKNSVAAGKNFRRLRRRRPLDGDGGCGGRCVASHRHDAGERRIAAAFQRGQADPQHPQDDRLPVRHHAPVTGRPAGDGLAAWGGTTPNTAALVEGWRYRRGRGVRRRHAAQYRGGAGRRARAMSDTANAKATNMNGAESLVGTLVASA